MPPRNKQNTVTMLFYFQRFTNKRRLFQRSQLNPRSFMRTFLELLRIHREIWAPCANSFCHNEQSRTWSWEFTVLSHPLPKSHNRKGCFKTGSLVFHVYQGDRLSLACTGTISTRASKIEISQTLSLRDIRFCSLQKFRFRTASECSSDICGNCDRAVTSLTSIKSRTTQQSIYHGWQSVQHDEVPSPRKHSRTDRSFCQSVPK